MSDGWEETRARLRAQYEGLTASRTDGIAIVSVADIRAALQRVEELERQKHGTPCKCEEWIEACRKAEARVQELEQQHGTLEEMKTLNSIEHHYCEQAMTRMEDAVVVMEAQQKRAEAAEAKLARCVEAGNYLQNEARQVIVPGRGHLIDAIEMWTSAALAAAKGGE